MRRQLANNLIRLASTPTARRFQQALKQPELSQTRILTEILSSNASSRYGRLHGFERIRSAAEYQDCVPIVDYDSLEPFIEAIKAGEQSVLSAEPVLMLEKTGGSTSASKYIPYTARLRSEFQAATSVWLHDLLSHRPGLRPYGAYWSVSAVGMARERTEGGLAVGFEDDTEYFGHLDRWVLSQLMLVPPDIKHVADMDTVRYLSLRFLLASDALGLVSVWNPSFLTLLVAAIAPYADRLIEDISRGTLRPPSPLPPELATLTQRLRPQPRRAAQVREALRSDGRLDTRALWPHLQLISCWTGASAARFLPELQDRFPGVEIQGKGLLATEGVVSIPLLGHPGSVVAVNSHFYEFEPESGGRPHLVHELAVGGRYTVLLTTGGGLYRYRLHDLVEVVGMHGRTPLIEFVGKTSKVSDICGEKLNELHVARVLERETAHLRTGFVMLAPEWDSPPYYALFIESTASDDELAVLQQRVEACLKESHHYAYCRSLGQLGPLRVLRVKEAQATYLAACEAQGQKSGNIKATYLHRAFGWMDRFGLVNKGVSMCQGPADVTTPQHAQESNAGVPRRTPE